MALWWEQWLTASAQEKDRMAPPFWIIESSAALFSECQLGTNDLAGAGPRVPMGRIEVEWMPPLSAGTFVFHNPGCGMCVCV
jgi:hypothetical protein